MSTAKIEIRIAEINFSGEGDPVWLSEQLDKILEKAAYLTSLTALSATSTITPSNEGNVHIAADLSGHKEISTQPLAVWLREKNADSIQTAKFLATAIWIETKGKKRLKTKDISAALGNANQRKLNNPSDCLNQNIKKGFCEKEGDMFYVTEEGKRSLGII